MTALILAIFAAVRTRQLMRRDAFVRAAAASGGVDSGDVGGEGGEGGEGSASGASGASVAGRAGWGLELREYLCTTEGCWSVWDCGIPWGCLVGRRRAGEGGAGAAGWGGGCFLSSAVPYSQVHDEEDGVLFGTRGRLASAGEAGGDGAVESRTRAAERAAELANEGNLLEKLDYLKQTLGINPEVPMLEAVAEANKRVGLPNGGPLKPQVDRLVQTIGLYA